MTLDVHHPSSADVHPLGEGLGARRCRQRASERDMTRVLNIVGVEPLVRYLRNNLKAARTSSENSFGSSQAAKCPPRSTSLK